MASPTYYIDDATVTTRESEVPNADFDGGGNLAGSCAPGIGIGVGTANVVGTSDQFTLLNQAGAARVPQNSQHIGGNGLGAGVAGTLPNDAVRSGTVSTTGDGTITSPEDVALQTLTAGWVAPAV
jgi:hypothetical protein